MDIDLDLKEKCYDILKSIEHFSKVTYTAHKNGLNSTDSAHLFNLPSAQWHNFLRT